MPLWVLTILLGVACQEPDPLPAELDTITPAPLPTLAEVVRATDRRDPEPTLERAQTAPDPALRAAAARGWARLHHEDAVAALLTALRDPDPAVRSAGSLGLGAQTTSRPAHVRALSGALAVETDPAVRAAMLRDLGRLHTARGLAVIATALAAESASERAAACLGVAEIGLAQTGRAQTGRVQVPVPSAHQRRIASLLAATQPLEVRRAAAYALGRIPLADDPSTSRVLLDALGLAVADPDAEVRAFAHRALARMAGADPAVAAHGTRDPEWRVAIQAVRALGQIAVRSDDGPRRMADTLSALAAGIPLETPRVHVLIAGLQAAAPMARTGPVHDAAAVVHAQLADGAPSRARGLAHCAAAELVDRGRGWPSRLESCGLGEVARWESQVQEANVLGALDGAVSQRLVRLRRLFSQSNAPPPNAPPPNAPPSRRVQQAVLRAAALIVHPEATELVLRGFTVDDAGVRATALQSLVTLARRTPSADVAPPPLPAEATLRALRSSLEAAGPHELETLVTWLEAADAVDARSLAASVRSLAAHPSHGVRERARSLLAAWDLPSDDAPPRPETRAVPDPVQTSLAPSDRPRVRLQTAHGNIDLELRPDQAPTTVARFLQLVDAGFYDGLTFHRVVAGFVAQGGDPRGDGYGGPAFWQRCEDNRLPYHRGTVGMALAGRDTGGSQFFITHGPTPHLELRYTAFASVVDGMPLVDRLLEGDVIEQASRLPDR